MNSQENKEEDDVDVDEVTINSRKQSKKMSLEMNHQNPNHIPINKLDTVTNTADQMQ